MSGGEKKAQTKEEPKPGRALAKKAPEVQTKQKDNLVSQLRSFRMSRNRGSRR